jgi:hypothetical protein
MKVDAIPGIIFISLHILSTGCRIDGGGGAEGPPPITVPVVYNGPPVPDVYDVKTEKVYYIPGF